MGDRSTNRSEQSGFSDQLPQPLSQRTPPNDKRKLKGDRSALLGLGGRLVGRAVGAVGEVWGGVDSLDGEEIVAAMMNSMF